MRGSDHFHTGITTDRYEATLAELSSRFGYEWCSEIAMPTTVWLPDGDTQLPLCFRYSRTTPRLEIIRSLPGTPWDLVPGSGIHHLGYWSDDVTGDCAELQRDGYALEATGRNEDGEPQWAYLHQPGAPRVELVSRALQAGMEQYWASPDEAPLDGAPSA